MNNDQLIGIKDDILRHARECAPEECCGFIVIRAGKTVSVRSENKAEPDRINFFRTDPEVLEKIQDAGDEVVGVYHSHPNERAEATMADKAESEAHSLPFLIVGWPADEERVAQAACAPERIEWCLYNPTGVEFPYEGRPFVHGSLDCFTLMRDWYRRELGIKIPDFERADNWWTVHGQDLYRDNMKATGFVRVRDDEIQFGDVMLFSVGETLVPNHAAIYLGDGIMLHHPPARLSMKAPFVCDRGYYGKHMWAVCRHVSRIDEKT